MAEQNSKIRLSIIISCYSNIPYFSDALDSFLNSGYHFRNTEFVICDDASPAGGDGDTARRYMQKYPDLFRMIRHDERKGIAVSYHDLVEAARGDYVLVFDADDIFVPFDLDASMDYLDAHPECGASYGRKRLFNDEEGDMGTVHGGEASLFAMTFDPRIVHNGMLIRVSDLKAVGSYMPTNLGVEGGAADISMWIRLALVKELHFEFPLRAFFRVHKRQKTSAANNHHRQEYQYLGDKLIERYRDLYDALAERRQLTISAEQRNAAQMLLGLLYHRAEDPNLKLAYLDAATTVMPEDYATYELRADLLLKTGHPHEALDNAFRQFLLYPNGSYATYQAMLKARQAAEALKYPADIYRRAEQTVLGRVFYLDDVQKQLFQQAIQTGFRAKQLAMPSSGQAQ